MQIKSIREASLNEKAFEGPNYLAWYKSSKIVPEKIHKKPSLNNKIQLKEATRKWISTRAANEEHAWQLNYLNTKRDWVKTPQSHTKKTRKLKTISIKYLMPPWTDDRTLYHRRETQTEDTK